MRTRVFQSRNRRNVTPVCESFEARLLMAVNFAIDATADIHPISRYIYGVNSPLSGALDHATSTRLGGNRWTAYNWENNASNAGSDYFYQNDSFLGGGATPGGAVSPTIASADKKNPETIYTVPLGVYVAGYKNGGGDVRNSGADYLSTRFNQILPRKGSAFSLSPNLADDYVYADEFVNWMKSNYPYGESDPLKPIFFELDNEPDLWSSTHQEIHPTPVTYAELIQKSIDYSKAIKDVESGAKVFGPVSYGWNGYTTLQNATDAGGRDFLNTYLSQLKAASDVAGRRLLDVLNLHWYPEAQDNGVRITGTDTSAAVVAARLQAPRSLWDPTYTETSWITQYSTNGPINLINRIKSKIAANYAGTQLAFTEYNYGAGGHISGGIAQADVLGIFGRENVFAANQWPINANETFVGGAFRMFRNYDGAGAAFGDTSIRAANSDTVNSSVYASVDSANPNVMTIVAINKTAAALPANVSLAGRLPASGQSASVYQLTSASASPVAAASIALSSGSTFAYSMPAYSVTTIRVPLAPRPKVIGANFVFQSSPNAMQFTFDSDVSTSLAPADLQVTSGSTNIAATAVQWNAATKTATFLLPVNLPDGNYHAVLAASGVSSSGVALQDDGSLNFFVLPGDANRDRTVDFNDLVILAQNYNTSDKVFENGDFNYDGTVDFNDLVLLAQRYNTTLPAPAAQISAPAALSLPAKPKKPVSPVFSIKLVRKPALTPIAHALKKL